MYNYEVPLLHFNKFFLKNTFLMKDVPQQSVLITLTVYVGSCRTSTSGWITGRLL